MISVGIIGQEGIIGSTLFKLLQVHPFVKIIHTSHSLNIEESDLIFLCVPNGKTKEYVNKFVDKRIIDLSVDNRSNWIYGLPEINSEKIYNSKHVSNPGCYANSIILSLLPVVKYLSCVSTVSLSGITSSGKREINSDNFRMYNKTHNHIAEIKNILSLSDFTFIPQCSDSTERGIISTSFTKLTRDFSIDELTCLYHEHYDKNIYIKILSEEEIIQTKDVLKTNRCHIKLVKNSKHSYTFISVLDNILKGGASQAIQNMNCMFGLDQTTGLNMFK